MNYKIKIAIRSWERDIRYAMPQGGKMTLSFILEEERDRAKNNPTDVAMPEFLDAIHPCLYPLFVIDWKRISDKRIPAKFRGDRIQFLRDVMGEWLKECGKKNYFNDGMFTAFENIHQVEESIEYFTDKDMTYLNAEGQPSLDYVDMEFRMGERQQEISKQKKLEDLAAQEQRELEEKAQRKREEAERKAATEAAAKNITTTPTPTANIDQLMFEAQQLFDLSPLPKVMLQLYVRPADCDEPYTAELVWDNTGQSKKDRRPSDVFTGPSFPVVIGKAKTHVSDLIDELINEQQKEKHRRDIQQQIDDQNTAFQKQMDENRLMIEKLQQMMDEQKQQHIDRINQLQQQISEL